MESIRNLTFYIKIKSSKQKRKIIIENENFLKKVNFQDHIFRNEKKAEKSEIRNQLAQRYTDSILNAFEITNQT